MFNKLITSLYLTFGAVTTAETNDFKHTLIVLAVAFLSEYLKYLRNRNNDKNNNLKTN